jgi:hypothetical protein
MFANQNSAPNIAAAAATILRNLRDSIAEEEKFYKWLSEQTDEDLTNAGFTNPQDIAFLRSAFTDQHNLFIIAYGGPVPQGVTLPTDFTANATQVIGV